MPNYERVWQRSRNWPGAGLRGVPGRGWRFYDFENLLLQFRQIASDNFPHGLKIDPKVLVGQDIPKAHHVAPQLIAGWAFRKSSDSPRQASPGISR